MHESRVRASERRQLTVLFCDIVDSTGLSERCDPEDLSEILLEFQAICTRCVNDAGGSVVNYIGDGIRCEFGYPLSSENEAEAAVRAGLAILAAIEGLEAGCLASIQEPLRVRIGVHTGLAVIGRGGAGHVHDATEIVGDTPNIAFRLQEIGGPNSLVISAETNRLLRGKFTLRPLGEHSLKGLSRKTHAYLVLGEALDGLATPSQDLRTVFPMVGRGAQMDQLLSAWATVTAGRGQAVEITGEAGIGKSRLASELMKTTGLTEDRILRLQSSAQHQNTPLFPIVRTLEQKFGVQKNVPAEQNLARLRQVLATQFGSDEDKFAIIGHMLGLSVSPPSAAAIPDASEIRRKTRDAVADVLTAHAWERPGILLVEDLHWSDPSTSEVVELIASRIESSRLLLITTSRVEGMDSSARPIRQIALSRLSDSDCHSLANVALRDERLPQRLLERIVARSDGVPLFVEELTAAALETGQVDTIAGGVEAASGGNGVPSPLYDSLMLRLERLGDAKTVAQLASVIGRSFSHQLLALLASEEGIALETPLARLLEAGLIRREDVAEKTYSFKHALVRDVAYHSLLKRRRRVLHARVADKIEVHLQDVADREPDYFAQHLSEAGRAASAVRMWLKAAQLSSKRSANLETLAQLRAALEQVEKLPAGTERNDLELSVQVALIAPTLAISGFSSRAVADVSSRAIELCRSLNEDPRIFPALYARWSNLRVAGEVGAAAALANEFLTLAEQKGTRTDRMVGHRLVGTSLIDWETERACGYLEKAISLYDPERDKVTALVYGTDVQVTSLSNLSIGYWLLGKIDFALARGRSALTLALELKHAFTFGYAFAHTCMVNTLERDSDTVNNLATQMLAAATERELPLWMSVSRAFLGWCEIETGHLREGIKILESERRFLRAAHVSYWLPMYLCWLAEAYADTGNPEGAKSSVAEARAIIGDTNFWYECECLRIEARLAEDRRPAEHLFEQALTLGARRGQVGFSLRAAHSFAQHLARNGLPERGRNVLRQALLPFADQSDRGDRKDARELLRSIEQLVPS